jgi:8-oxo-dGTP diphosphatase
VNLSPLRAVLCYQRAGCLLLTIGYSLLATELLAADYWLLATCYGLLATGCLLLATGYCTFEFMADHEQIVAAGGLVIDDSTKPPRVLLVHRQRYDDWSFPKGKALPGESLAQTALREVSEETGLQCRIISEFASVQYEYRSPKGHARPKIVHYYLMRAEGTDEVGDTPHPDGVEVDKLEWLTPAQAAERLSYEYDRNLLRQLEAKLDTQQ